MHNIFDEYANAYRQFWKETQTFNGALDEAMRSLINQGAVIRRIMGMSAHQKRIILRGALSDEPDSLLRGLADSLLKIDRVTGERQKSPHIDRVEWQFANDDRFIQLREPLLEAQHKWQKQSEAFDSLEADFKASYPELTSDVLETIRMSVREESGKQHAIRQAG